MNQKREIEKYEMFTPECSTGFANFYECQAKTKCMDCNETPGCGLKLKIRMVC